MPEHVLFQVALDFGAEVAALKVAVEERLFAALEFPVPVQRLLVPVAFETVRTEKVSSRV